MVCVRVPYRGRKKRPVDESVQLFHHVEVDLVVAVFDARGAPPHHARAALGQVRADVTACVQVQEKRGGEEERVTMEEEATGPTKRTTAPEKQKRQRRTAC